MKDIISKKSQEIDKIQLEIAVILSLRDEGKYHLIIEMTEKIARLAWDACIETLSTTSESRDTALLDCLRENIHENGTVYSDEELQIKRQDIGHIYILKDGNYFRVGKSIDVEKRVRTHLGSSPTTFLFYKSPLVEQHSKLETKLHQVFKDIHIRNEWFKSTDKEVIKTTERILKGFINV